MDLTFEDIRLITAGLVILPRTNAVGDLVLRLQEESFQLAWADFCTRNRDKSDLREFA